MNTFFLVIGLILIVVLLCTLISNEVKLSNIDEMYRQWDREDRQWDRERYHNHMKNVEKKEVK